MDFESIIGIAVGTFIGNFIVYSLMGDMAKGFWIGAIAFFLILLFTVLASFLADF